MLNIKVLGNKVPGNKVPRNIVPMIRVTEEHCSGTSYGLCLKKTYPEWNFKVSGRRNDYNSFYDLLSPRPDGEL